MAGVSREQIDRAKQVNILDYLLSHEPDNIRRVGKTHYLKDHDSFRVSNGLWKWESQGIGGKNVIDYLIKVRGYGFVDAVRHLTGEYEPRPAPSTADKPVPKPKLPFMLPLRNSDNERAIAYLQNRGIDLPIIQGCINNGSIYESARWHNCVFVGRDDNGKARYATMRGTIGDFKCDADGSDKSFGFTIPKRGSSTVAVFESPVDALSHQVLSPRFSGWRLSLGGTSLAALTNFLERHKDTKSVIICTDNDDAGDKAAKRIRALPGISAIRVLPLNKQKDWNDALLSIKSKPSITEQLESAKIAAREHNAQSRTEYKGVEPEWR